MVVQTEQNKNQLEQFRKKQKRIISCQKSMAMWSLLCSSVCSTITELHSAYILVVRPPFEFRILNFTSFSLIRSQHKRSQHIKYTAVSKNKLITTDQNAILTLASWGFDERRGTNTSWGNVNSKSLIYSSASTRPNVLLLLIGGKSNMDLYLPWRTAWRWLWCRVNLFYQLLWSTIFLNSMSNKRCEACLKFHQQ